MSIADIISVVASVIVVAAVGGLAIWTVRNRDAEIDALREQLDARESAGDREQSQAQALEQLSAKMEALLQQQSQTEPTEDVQPVSVELPDEARKDLSHVLALLQELKAAPRPSEAPASAPADLNIETALDAYDKARGLDPNDPATPMNHGIVLLRLGRTDQALAAFGRALALQPDHGDTLYNRACLYSLQRQSDEALNDLRLAIEADPKYRQMAAADTDLESLSDDLRFRELVN